MKAENKGRRPDPQKDEAILGAASALFLRRGYGVSISEIAAAAGVSKQTIYSRHHGKAGLLAAIVRRTAVDILRSMDFSHDCEGFEAALTRFGEKLIEVNFDPGRIAMLRLLIAESSRFPDLAELYYQNGPAFVRAELAKRIEAEAAAGRLSIENASVCASMFFGLITGGDQLLMLVDAPSIIDQHERKRRVKNAVSAFMKIFRPAETLEPLIGLD